MFPYHYALVILRCVGEAIILMHGYYILALKHIRTLLGRYVLLACIYTLYKYGHAWVKSEILSFNYWA